MKTKMLIVVALLSLASLAYGQGSLTYTFPTHMSTGWPGWTVKQSPSMGSVQVQSLRTVYVGFLEQQNNDNIPANNTWHLTWDASSVNPYQVDTYWTPFEAIFARNRYHDNGTQFCDTNDALMADHVNMLTLHDDGSNYIAAVIGTYPSVFTGSFPNVGDGTHEGIVLGILYHDSMGYHTLKIAVVSPNVLMNDLFYDVLVPGSIFLQFTLDSTTHIATAYLQAPTGGMGSQTVSVSYDPSKIPASGSAGVVQITDNGWSGCTGYTNTIRYSDYSSFFATY